MKHFPSLFFSCALACSACGGAPETAPETANLTSAAPIDRAQLLETVELFYKASTPEEMRKQVNKAQQLAPQSAWTHEIEAELARMEGRDEDYADALIAALRDLSDDASRYHIEQALKTEKSRKQNEAFEDALQRIMEAHSNAQARDRAAFILAQTAHLKGKFKQRDQLFERLPGWLPLAIIGTWSNDQGKGYDSEEAPERSIEKDARYPGSLVQIGWRDDYPQNPVHILDFGSLFEPKTWQLAYGAASVEVSENKEYLLKISSSAPIKIFVNDAVVFEGPLLEKWLFEAIEIPVSLHAGVNTILLKSAQTTGAWRLSARLLDREGHADYKLRPFDTPQTATNAENANPSPMEASELLHLWDAIPSDARKLLISSRWASWMGLHAQAAAFAEAYAALSPTGIIARETLSQMLEANKEQGLASDLLTALVDQFGSEFPALSLQQIESWLRLNLEEKARQALLKLTEKPQYRSAHMALAQFYKSQGWKEESCRILEEADRTWPEMDQLSLDLADCYESIGLPLKAEALRNQLLRQQPVHTSLLEDQHGRAMKKGDYDQALRIAEKLIAANPQSRGAYMRKAEALRQQEKFKEAHQALEMIEKIAPTAPQSWLKRAKISLQARQDERAIDELKAALARDPENAELAARIDHLAPETGEWLTDVPDDAAIQKALKAATCEDRSPSAELITLLDDEVTLLNPDGSASCVVTAVSLACNQNAVDNLTHMRMRAGRSRVLQAFAIDAQGNRLDASTIRGTSIRFRNLTVGSAVVLQYRVDESPEAYLAGNAARTWWFQGFGYDNLYSRWVLYMPKNFTLAQEFTHGEITQSVENKGDLTRYEWLGKDFKSLTPERHMPHLSELTSRLSISTVPSWDMFVQWELALLQGAFRKTPTVTALAQKLAEGTNSVQEKIYRIQDYLISHIRYQQDYEHVIAGVKPHAASVVLARQYGDCKDKAVLFIALAKELGIEAHFALVRTRDEGPLAQKLPMQQFNHAIVYIPKQEGVSEGRFYDPTVEALDLRLLRGDDQGTRSLVLNPETREWRFIDIPFDSLLTEYCQIDHQYSLDWEGEAEGQMKWRCESQNAEAMRILTRNPNKLNRSMDQVVHNFFPGGSSKQDARFKADDLTKPVEIEIGFKAPNVARKEGKEFRIPVIQSASPHQLFSEPKRVFPMDLSHRLGRQQWHAEITLPQGAKIARLPKSQNVETPCITQTLSVKAEGQRVILDESLAYRCPRIDPKDWAQYRKAAEQMKQNIDQEIVFKRP